MAETEVKNPAENVAHSTEEWSQLKEKCLTYDKNLRTLKNLSKKALIEFERLKSKYNEVRDELAKEQKDHSSTKKELEQLQEEIKKLKHNTAKAFDEYGELQAKLELEKELRAHAESLASEVVNKNRRLRTAGKSLLQLNAERSKEAGEDLTVLTEPEEEPEDVSSKLEQMKDQIHALTQELESTREKLTDTLGDLHEARKKLDAQQPSGMTKEQEEHIKKVSQIAYDEYLRMQEELEVQKECREELEKIAAEVVSENRIIRRKSHVLLTSANEDERTKKLSEEVAKLSKELELQTVKHKKEVGALKAKNESLKKPKYTEKISALEERLSATRKELDLMERRAVAAERRAQQLEETAQATEAAPPSDDAAPPAPGPPPPPPPAPPPVPPVPQFRPISEILKEKPKKAKSKRKDAEPKDPRVDAMSEMISRIKEGVALKKTGTVPKQKPSTVDASAMAQLASQFKLKKRSTSEAPVKKEQAIAVSDELAKKLRKMKEKSEDQPDWAGPEDLPPPPPSVAQEELETIMSPLSKHLDDYKKRIEAETQEAEEEDIYDEIQPPPPPPPQEEEVYDDTTAGGKIDVEEPIYAAPQSGEGETNEEEVVYEDTAALPPEPPPADAPQEEDIYEAVS